MKRLAIGLVLVAATVFGSVSSASAQYYTTYYPVTAYYQPSTVYYTAAPTAYYASSPTTVYYGPAPATTYYASAPTTVYYGGPQVQTYYRPLVGGVTRVRYYSAPVVYPRTASYGAYYPWW